MSTPLPEFEKPPIDELAIGVQFDPLPGWHAPHAGLYWERIRVRYSRIEEQSPLPAVVEPSNAEPAKVGFAVRPGMPSPRIWFLTTTGEQLVQVQRDRFLRNWRLATGSEDYPRYQNLIKGFRQELEGFRSFVQSEGLGELKVNQCELTYVDNIERNPEELGNLWQVFTFLNDQSGGFLPQPEMMAWEARYKLPKERGRLHLVMNPAFRGRDMKTVISLTTTARGAPESAEDDKVFDWFDLAHDWINRAFDQLTTPSMHLAWKKKP